MLSISAPQVKTTPTKYPIHHLSRLTLRLYKQSRVLLVDAPVVKTHENLRISSVLQNLIMEEITHSRLLTLSISIKLLRCLLCSAVERWSQLSLPLQISSHHQYTIIRCCRTLSMVHSIIIIVLRGHSLGEGWIIAAAQTLFLAARAQNITIVRKTTPSVWVSIINHHKNICTS